MSTPEQVTIVGAGLMGHGIAQVFAMHGHPVRLTDTNRDILHSAKDRVHANLANMASRGVKLDLDKVLGNINITEDLPLACRDSSAVIEAVFEDLGLKQQVFADLDRICPPTTILCSNTSVISITEIACRAKQRDRIVGTHFWNPPYLIPLVEVVRAKDTADWCTAATYALLQRVGKHPVHVHKDVPGFVGNRLQHALWREAFSIIDEGICDAATVDEVIRNGFGLRLPILGPVENADMIGLDLTLAIHNYILKHLNAAPTPSSTLRALVEAGHVGFKTGQGFRQWSESDIAAARARLADYLIDAFVQGQKDKESRS